MAKNYDVITFFQNTLILRRHRVANFADTIKIAPAFIKKALKTQKKLREL